MEASAANAAVAAAAAAVEADAAGMKKSLWDSRDV
jgi:hypothetical protein